MTRLRSSVSIYILLFIFSALTCLPYLLSAQTIINTVAGTGAPSFGGDGGPSTAANVNEPYDVATDNWGNVYIADNLNNRIRKIDTNGVIFTIGGTGTAGFSGDGGPATNAQMYVPRYLTVDASGTVFFSDYANNRIRKITPAGIISTVAGNGLPGFSGDGGAATAAQLNFAWGVATDAAGNLYIADQLNCRIRKVTPAGIISTIGGTGIAFFSGDGGPAVSAGIQYPMGIVCDGPGNLYICDEGDCRIRKINTSGIISTVAGNGFGGFLGDGGPATNAKLYYPNGIARDSLGNLYLADLGNNRIRMVSATGTISTIAGTGTAGYSGDGGPPLLANINQPTGVAIDKKGNIYIADKNNSRVRILQTSNHAPFFINGHHISRTMCPVESFNLDSLLMVFDIDTGQTETWSVVVPPLHGSVSGGYSTTSTGSFLLPSGITYVPITGYTGLDSFTMRITDGTFSDTTNVVIDFLSLPTPGAITGIDSLCPGYTYLFSDTSAGGTWSSTDTTIAGISSTGTVTGKTDGSILILYSVTNVCGTVSASFPLKIAADCHTGTGTVTGPLEDNLSILPNPNNGAFRLIYHADKAESVSIVITSLPGSKMKEIHTPANTAVDVQAGLEPGVYIVTAYSGDGNRRSSLLVVR